MLDEDIFSIVVDSVPLVSIDILLKKDNKILLGKRVNKPAKGYFFTAGGRVKKNEEINQAMKRIAKDELGIELKYTPRFIGVFEHFYEKSMFENISIHYVNLAYEYKVESLSDLPTEQHSEYRWFTVGELMHSKQVHKYVKNYFRG